MYIFGGLGSASKGGNLQTLHSCKLNLSPEPNGDVDLSFPLFYWEKVKAEAPKARDSHTCVAYDDTLIMFGGCGSGRDSSFGDLNKYCIKK